MSTARYVAPRCVGWVLGTTAIRPPLAVTPTTSECSAQLAIMVCQIEDWLRQVRGLYDTPHLHRTFLFNQLADRKKQIRRELERRACQSRISQVSETMLTSEYHLYCHVISLIRHPSIALVSPSLSYIFSKPFVAFGENLIFKHCW